MIALDIKTGKEVWRTKSSDPKDGYSMTATALVAQFVADPIFSTRLRIALSPE